MTEYKDIGPLELLGEAKRIRDAGQRLVQIHCSQPEGFEIIYSFDGSEGFRHYRVALAEGEGIHSITDFFPAAFLYENEVSELFGIAIEGISIDYAGRMYATGKKAPFRKKLAIGPVPAAAATGSADGAREKGGSNG